MIVDETQPMEGQAVEGILQMAAGRRFFRSTFGMKDDDSESDEGDARDDDSAPDPAHAALVKVHHEGVSITRAEIASKHIFLAAIVPMFLLFGAAGSARGLLESVQTGEIRRYMVAPIAAAHVLLGQLASAVVTLMIQSYVMYVYGWAVFGVDIGSIAGGLFVLTLTTSVCCATFGMFMAALCRTSEQLDGLGMMVILAMSAVGGSMVPRFVMPEFMQKLGVFTINGWAHDGFIALIRNEGWHGILVPGLVLLTTAAVFATTGSIALSRRLRTA
jgi:ABC-2 type transport system permease protein